MKNDITYDSLLEKIPNKYILTIVSGARSREIAKDRAEKAKLETVTLKSGRKTTDMQKVFKEILEGKIDYEDK